MLLEAQLFFFINHFGQIITELIVKYTFNVSVKQDTMLNYLKIIKVSHGVIPVVSLATSGQWSRVGGTWPGVVSLA